MMRRRDLLLAGAASLVPLPALAATALPQPEPYTLDQWPPLTDRAAYIAWMLAHRADDANFAGERFDRYKVLLDFNDLWTKEDKRAFLFTPREAFVRPEDIPNAYVGHYLDIGFGVTLTPPGTMGRMTSAIEVKPTDRVLEVGTGSGYSAAVLARLAAEVVSVERHEELALAARQALAELGVGNVEVIVGDGSRGVPERAPFEAIAVHAAAPAAPPALLAQLADGGRMVVPIAADSAEQLTLLRRDGERLRSTDLGPCRFVPLIGEQGY